MEPTITDLEANPTSVRHAFLACVAVFHSIDYLAFPRHSRSLRQKFGKASPDFAIVDNVAHAFKHVSVGPRDNPHLKAEDVIPRHAGTFGHFTFGEHVFNDTGQWVTLKSDRNIRLLDVVRTAARFLRTQMALPQT